MTFQEDEKKQISQILHLPDLADFFGGCFVRHQDDAGLISTRSRP